jgi:uncharacterized protein (TIGR02145 family)
MVVLTPGKNNPQSLHPSKDPSTLIVPTDESAGNPILPVSDTPVSPTRNNTLMDIDGNVYTSVIIGTQEWLVQNLKVGHYADGSEIKLITSQDKWDNLYTQGKYAYPFYDPTTYGQFGPLYDGYVFDNPAGIVYIERDGVHDPSWRIPLLTDIQNLITFLGDVSIAGGKLKDTGLLYWEHPNLGATNSTGFTLRGTGCIDAEIGLPAADNGRMLFFKLYSFFYVLKIDGSIYGNSRCSWGGTNVFYSMDQSKTYGNSIRLVRDIS